MPKLTHKATEKLIRELLLPFYEVRRDLYFQVGQNRRPENDAEHSWSLSVLACAMAPNVDTTLDIGKVAQFAIVHDLVEVYADDTSPWGEAHKVTNKEQREEEALHAITENFSEFPWIAETINEYEQKESNEAKFVWALDKYITLAIRYMDNGQFFKDNKITKEVFDKKLAANRPKAAAHPAVKDFYEAVLELFEAHPEQFHK